METGQSVTPVHLSQVQEVEFKLVQHLSYETSLEAGYTDWVTCGRWEGVPYYNKVAPLTKGADMANIVISEWNTYSVETQSEYLIFT